MELTAAIAVLVAALVPWGTALLTHPTMAPWLKRSLAAGVAVILGTVVALATGQIEGAPAELAATLGRWLVTVAIVISLAQGYYAAFKDGVKRVEQVTDYTARRAA